MIKKALLFTLFGLISFASFASEINLMEDESIVVKQEDVMTFDVILNSNLTIRMENTPKTGYLEIYSILGVKVSSAELRNCANGISFTLPKGIYIFKAGKVAKKVLVR